MLVLTRKTNDYIVIDGKIKVEVLKIQGGGIRLGITAPKELSIRRGELKPKKTTERQPPLVGKHSRINFTGRHLNEFIEEMKS